jgi:peptidoglycan hydrolase CwlO-like protein
MKIFLPLALLLITTCFTVTQAKISSSEGQARISRAQAERDASKKQLLQLDGQIQQLQEQAGRLNASPDSAEEVNALNRKLKELIAQRTAVVNQHKKTTDAFTQEVKAVGRKHRIDAHDGNYQVSSQSSLRSNSKI